MLTRMQIIALLSFTIVQCNAVLRIWQPPELNPWQYFGKNKFCSERTIVYPRDLSAAIVAPENYDNLLALILPGNGALTLQQNKPIFFNYHGAACSSDTEYIRRRFAIRHWFSTRNWKSVGFDMNKATPHIEQIPCECDKVVFPANQSISVDLPLMATELAINEIEINGKQSNFELFRQSQLGQLMFDNSVDVNVKTSQCDLPTFCSCISAAHFGDYLSMLCRDETPRCPRAKCLEPIRPIGHCCEICGATLLYTTVANRSCEKDSNLKHFMRMVTHVLTASDYEDSLDLYASVMPQVEHTGKYILQLIVVDRNDYQGYSVEFINKLIADDQFTATFGERLMIKLESGMPFTPSEHSSAFLLIFGPLLLVLIFFTIINVYYNQQPKWLTHWLEGRSRFFSSPFMFARFDNTADDGTSCINVELDKGGDGYVFEDIAEGIEAMGPNTLNDMQSLSGTTSTSVTNLVEVELDAS